MKRNHLIYFILTFVFPSLLFSQIQNSSFESWDTVPWVQPTGWVAPINAFDNFITQSSDAHDGSSSARMEIKELFGERAEPGFETGGFGDPINTRPNKLNLFYKSDFKNFARLEVYISTWDSNASTGSLLPSGSVNTSVKNSTANWTLLEVPIDYFSTEHIPAYISIIFALTDSAETNDLSALGSSVLIDDLSLDQPTDVKKIDEIPKHFELSQNYPNPFNPSTKIEYSIAKSSFVNLTVYDILGNQVAELVNESQTAGNYRYNFNGANLASGIYIVQLQAGDLHHIRKMILMK